jgi:simple sugar transport system ATP-binding protein
LHEFLVARNISKHFAGVQALRNVSIGLKRGEIRCLVGENGCGKSTLVKIIAGAYRPDAGEITVGGQTWSQWRPIDAIRQGIQVIYQDLSLFPNLTVEENLAMNTQLEQGWRWVDWRKVRRIATQATERIGISLDLSQPVSALPVAGRQLVSIARALLHDARLIIMDEPTAALTQKEVEGLFEVIRKLQSVGVSVLFVSHKLKEVLDISEQITILRNGEKVAEGETAHFDQRSLTYYMTGRELSETRYHFPGVVSDTPSLLRIEQLSRRGRFEDISFELFPGEVVGITGLLGSGRTALARTLFGIEPADRGTISVEGNPVQVHCVADAIRNGIAYVPEDRLSQGLFLEQSIERNISVGILDTLRGSSGLLDASRIRSSARQWIEEFNIKSPDGRAAALTLSGGNQQKTVLAKWLATRARILILNGPTVGVDVGAKMDIHRRIRELAEQGMAVLLVSDDLPEIVQTCSRVFLMHRGRFIEEFGEDRIDGNLLAKRLSELS